MLRSSNPILSKKDAFTPASSQQGQYGGYAGYQSQPADTRQGYSQQPMNYGQGYAPEQLDTGERMTFDDVITKTAIVMALLVASAAVSWNLLPPLGLTMPALIVSGLVGFVVVLMVAFRRQVSPPLVIAYALIEGVFIGMISQIFEAIYPGIVLQAIVGTFFAAGVTLAAYKFFNIRVTAKFQKIVFMSTIAFAAMLLVNFIFSLVTGHAGLRGGIVGPVSPLALGISAIAIVLAVLNLVLDFDYIERGVQLGAPAKQSWTAAFGLTVTMVWLYVEILRILSYLRR